MNQDRVSAAETVFFEFIQQANEHLTDGDRERSQGKEFIGQTSYLRGLLVSQQATNAALAVLAFGPAEERIAEVPQCEAADCECSREDRLSTHCGSCAPFLPCAGRIALDALKTQRFADAEIAALKRELSISDQMRRNQADTIAQRREEIHALNVAISSERKELPKLKADAIREAVKAAGSDFRAEFYTPFNGASVELFAKMLNQHADKLEGK